MDSRFRLWAKPVPATLLIVATTALWLPAANGGTNNVPLVPRELFVLSPLVPAPPTTPATNSPAPFPSPPMRVAPTDEAAGRVSLFHTGLEAELASAPGYVQKRVMWATESWGRPVRVIEQGGFYAQVLRIFPSPAFIEHHGVVVSGGVVTAIKRKNPLGLLNPIILDISF